MKLSKASIAVLIFQLVVVSSIAAKYLWQRHSCPRVWVRAEAFDPSLPMRGRYLSTRLLVDGCQSTLPTANDAEFERYTDGSVKQHGLFHIRARQTVRFAAHLLVRDGRLLAIRPDGVETVQGAQWVAAEPGTNCAEMRLDEPVLYFLSEHAQNPLPTAPGDQLWVEVTVPPSGPPRPLQLAVSSPAGWKALDLK